jgi:hypothetical protein
MHDALLFVVTDKRWYCILVLFMSEERKKGNSPQREHIYDYIYNVAFFLIDWTRLICIGCSRSLRQTAQKPLWEERMILSEQTDVARWRSWLRHCATSRNVAGSIPDGVIGIFHWHHRFSRTMALGSTQPLTEMSTRNISWGVKAAGA